jgi:hypothetical protein
MRLKKIIKRVEEQINVPVSICELNTNSDKKKYNIKITPAIVVDNKIISQGKILSDREIKKLILNTSTV